MLTFEVANLVGAPPQDRVALLERTEYLDEVAHARTAPDIHPLRNAVVHPNHKRSLGRPHDTVGGTSSESCGRLTGHCCDLQKQ